MTDCTMKYETDLRSYELIFKYSERKVKILTLKWQDLRFLLFSFKAIPHKDSAADAPSIFSSDCAKRAPLT